MANSNYDPFMNDYMSNQAMSRKEYEYRMMKMQAIQQAQQHAQYQQPTAPPSEPEKPKKPKHLNQKLLLTKGA